MQRDDHDKEKRRNKWQDYKYIQSKNGKYLLLYEGFSYRKYMTSKSRQSYWTCTLRGCKAKATLKPDGWFSLTKNTHNHEPNYEEMERKAIISELRKLTLETELSPAELLRQVGVVDDPDKKYRDTINFWRWRAKRKIEAESAGYYDDPKKLQFDGDYKFVKTHQSHFLQYKNYLYRKYMSSKVDSGSYWRCRRDDCPARAKLDSSALLTCTNFNHNHPEEEFEGEDMEQDIKQVVREMALNTDMPIGDILKLYQSEEDVELKKYIKNIRCRKERNLREKKRKVEEAVINQIEMLENVPPGVFVKIPKDLLCEISELTVNQEGEAEYPEGTIFKVDDRALVQVVNFDPDADSFDGELFFRNDTEEDEGEQTEIDQEVHYETVNMSDYTTYVIASDKEDDEEGKDMEEGDIKYQEVEETVDSVKGTTIKALQEK
ncbi:hypothetical protein RUM43_002969 [Polyplax serrata]|uniref:FLYWCH-type domain-containing protein n=1 Tax=Polyplax serrata TaxID=468196 RepID=A0AAN8S5A2_POLSC